MSGCLLNNGESCHQEPCQHWVQRDECRQSKRKGQDQGFHQHWKVPSKVLYLRAPSHLRQNQRDLRGPSEVKAFLPLPTPSPYVHHPIRFPMLELPGSGLKAPLSTVRLQRYRRPYLQTIFMTGARRMTDRPLSLASLHTVQANPSCLATHRQCPKATRPDFRRQICLNSLSSLLWSQGFFRGGQPSREYYGAILGSHGHHCRCHTWMAS